MISFSNEGKPRTNGADLSTYGDDSRVINDTDRSAYEQTPKADFYEPITYSWTKRRSQIRKIAKDYSK